MISKRPLISGTLPPATEVDDASYLAFIEGVRAFTLQQVESQIHARYQQAAATFARQHGRPPATFAEVRALLDQDPLVQARNRLWRSSQEMMWEGVIATYRKREAELLAELEEADRSGPGTVQWDPNFVYPDYVQAYEIHLQPGSYHRAPLAGYIYHYGTKIFFTGRNDGDALHRAQVQAAPIPADGQVRRILDLGCSIGQSTTAFKARFPAAEVWGIDIAAPMVRYAHKRAIDLGLEVHFAQMAAEQLRFPDGYFDLAHAFLLFHELPVPVIRQTIREVARVLRPGGLFVIYEFVVYNPDDPSPVGEYLLDFITRENGEPFAWDFCHLDFLAELRQGGFHDAQRIQTNAGRPAVVATR
ncbi:MAG: hypothetical protein KatS3mg061_3460 [Dehalococcoidia bacterium]|nr:MAG: hypothetical protein KatS3mg061_3460 [Dehalococcoidia bacterium]